MRPRLWGRFTFPLVAWCCGVALNDILPIVHRAEPNRIKLPILGTTGNRNHYGL